MVPWLFGLSLWLASVLSWSVSVLMSFPTTTWTSAPLFFAQVKKKLVGWFLDTSVIQRVRFSF